MRINSVESLTITTLADNLAGSKGLGQWGFSCFLDLVDPNGEDRRILFDTGMVPDALLFNLRALKVDLAGADCIVLSHGHYDHTGAIVESVRSAGGTKVYAHPHVFLPRAFIDARGKRREIGVPKKQNRERVEAAGGEIVFRREPVEVVPGMWTTGEIPRNSFEDPLPLAEGERLLVSVDGREVEDKILDDQGLFAVVEGVGCIVFAGCCHAGLINTLNHVKRLVGVDNIYGFVGGTHLVGRSDEYVEKTVSGLTGLKLISPCHCTGFRSEARLWKAFPEQFVLNYGGRVIEVGKEPKPRVI
jgi:7,8-dihydropterin-6-yl-methyl-4-(beta-D-ribofuranosyl)aminobenzene 5'-phosphate synthase